MSYTNNRDSIEKAILKSSVPINVNETEEINVLGQRGIWVNKTEVLNWRGQIPLSEYKLNDDPNPEIINKTSSQPVEYNQEISVRYLRPPTPPPHGELVIKQEGSVQVGPAPPVIIRQTAPQLPQPETVVIREEPPQLPPRLPRQVITISGKSGPAPERKVIIEKLPALPAKPPSVVIERWLPFPKPKRRVIFEGSTDVIHPPKERNIIINWQAPPANIKKSRKILKLNLNFIFFKAILF